MANYLSYIFGVSSLLLGLYLFLLSFGLYKPVYKDESRKERFDELIRKFGFLIKGCSILLIIRGGYNLVNPDPNRYLVGTKSENPQWHLGDREILVETCMRDVGEMGKVGSVYYKVTQDYCDCGSRKIMMAMSYDDYMKLSHEPVQKRLEKARPICQSCLDTFRNLIDSIKLDSQGK